jgi:hypothetical protein
VTDDIHRWLLTHLAGMDDRSLWILVLVVVGVIVLRSRLPPAVVGSDRVVVPRPDASRDDPGHSGG